MAVSRSLWSSICSRSGCCGCWPRLPPVLRRTPGRAGRRLTPGRCGAARTRAHADVSREVGELCAAVGKSDVIDAHLALLARDDDVVLTSDV